MNTPTHWKPTNLVQALLAAGGVHTIRKLAKARQDEPHFSGVLTGLNRDQMRADALAELPGIWVPRLLAAFAIGFCATIAATVLA